MDIFQMSFSVSVLIGAVVIIRALFLHRLPKKTFLALWGVVLLRLFVPFSIPFRFSFYTGIDMVMRLLEKRTTVYSPAVVTAIPDMVNIPVAESIGVGASATSTPPFEIVWLAGLCICALFFIVVYVNCHREFKMSLPVENRFAALWLSEHPLCRSVQIQQSDRIKAPLTYGILRPVILLPRSTDWTDEAKLRYILTHELVHIRRFDTMTKLVLTAAVCVHWFNPFVWVMYVLANRDIELSCDETVVRTFGETIKSAYAITLIGLEEKKSKLTPLVNNFSKNAIEERIVMIMKMKKISLTGMILAFSLVVGTITVFATTADTANEPATNNSYTASEISSSVVISRNDESWKPQISLDNGKTWMSEEEYEKAHPAPTVVWWTYEEYKQWLDNEKIQLQGMIGEKGWNQTEGWYVWTQERTDKAIKMYEGILEDIKNGIQVSKTVDGDENIVLSFDPKDIEMGTGKPEHTLFIRLDNGEEVTFGPYSTKKEMLTAVKPYCEEQVKAGNMIQQEADEIINKYQ